MAQHLFDQDLDVQSLNSSDDRGSNETDISVYKSGVVD